MDENRDRIPSMRSKNYCQRRINGFGFEDLENNFFPPNPNGTTFVCRYFQKKRKTEIVFPTQTVAKIKSLNSELFPNGGDQK